MDGNKNQRANLTIFPFMNWNVSRATLALQFAKSTKPDGFDFTSDGEELRFSRSFEDRSLRLAQMKPASLKAAESVRAKFVNYVC